MFYNKQLAYAKHNNHSLKFKDTQFKINSNIASKTFYPYNCIIDDEGWGCAWRCIQMILSSSFGFGFEYIFNNFNSKQQLLSIYLKCHNASQQIQSVLAKASWAPNQRQNLWAEPFIAQIILMNYQMPSKLLLLNGYPLSANAPRQIFQEPVLGFAELKTLIINHFDNNGGLVMIDDASYAMVIFGYQTQKENLKLFIADPHIKTNSQINHTGIYSVTLDEKGCQLQNSVTSAQRQYFCYPSYQSVTFYKKPWMILFEF